MQKLFLGIGPPKVEMSEWQRNIHWIKKLFSKRPRRIFLGTKTGVILTYSACFVFIQHKRTKLNSEKEKCWKKIFRVRIIDAPNLHSHLQLKTKVE